MSACHQSSVSRGGTTTVLGCSLTTALTVLPPATAFDSSWSCAFVECTPGAFRICVRDRQPMCRVLGTPVTWASTHAGIQSISRTCGAVFVTQLPCIPDTAHTRGLQPRLIMQQPGERLLAGWVEWPGRRIPMCEELILRCGFFD